MTVLVTGGTGFLGSYFTRYCLEQAGQKRVVVLDRYLDLGRIADVLPQVTVIEGDIADRTAVLEAIVRHEVSHVAHFAGILGSPQAGRMLDYVAVQNMGTATVFDCAREAGVQRVLFASSVAAYGKQAAAKLTEDLIPAPQNLYGASKLWGEALAAHYTDQLGLDVVTLRYGSTYGLGRAWRGSYSSGILSVPGSTHYMARLEDAVRGKPVVIPGGAAEADWTYAADGAQAAWLALTAEALPYRLFNVCSERLPITDFATAMRKVLPQANIVVSETETVGNAHAPQDATRLRELGFSPAFDLERGLTDYLHRIAVANDYGRAGTIDG